MKKISKLKLVTVLLFAAVLYGIAAAATNNPFIGLGFATLFLVNVFYNYYKYGRHGIINYGVFGADQLDITDTTWSGPALEAILLRSVYGADTVDKGIAHVITGVSRKQFMIPRLEVTVLMQAYSANPTALGGQDLDGRPLILQKFEMYTEFNPQDVEVHYFEQYYEEDLIRDETLPAILESAMLMQYMKRLNQWFENSFWDSRIMWNPAGANVAPTSKGYLNNALQAGTNYWFDGFVYKALTDSTVQIFPYNPSNWTTANYRQNVLSPMYSQLINNPISKGLAYKYGSDGLRVVESYGDQELLELAYTTDLYKQNDYTEKGINRFRGYDTVPLAGLSEGTIFMAIARPDLEGNFKIGMNTTEDVSFELKKVAYPSDNYGLKGIFKLDVNHGWGDQMILCTPVLQ